MPGTSAATDPRSLAVAEALARRRAIRWKLDFDRLGVAQQSDMIVSAMREAADFIAMSDALAAFPLPPSGRRGDG